MRREYQDFNFTVDCVANRTVTRLLGLVLDDAPDDAPCVVFAQFEDEADWHRFFLQAQIGFWEIWNSDTINDEFQNRIDDGDRLVDYGPLIGGLPQVLSVAAAIGTENAPTHMRLSFLNGRAISLVPDGPDLDANFHIVAESA